MNINKPDYNDYSDGRLAHAREYLLHKPFAGMGLNGQRYMRRVVHELIERGLTDTDITSVFAPWSLQCAEPWSDDQIKEEVANLRVAGERAVLEPPFPAMEGVVIGDTHKLVPTGERKPTNPKDAVGIRKPRFYSGMSAHVRRLVSLGMMEGAMKYGRHNYRPAAVRASVYYDATNEHLDSFWEGEDIDPDSKLPHVIKAICSLYVLADAIITGNLEDDRPPRTADVSEMKKAYQPLVDELFKRYPNPEPAFTHQNSSVPVTLLPANPWLGLKPVKPSEEK